MAADLPGYDVWKLASPPDHSDPCPVCRAQEAGRTGGPCDDCFGEHEEACRLDELVGDLFDEDDPHD